MDGKRMVIPWIILMWSVLLVGGGRIAIPQAIRRRRCRNHLRRAKHVWALEDELGFDNSDFLGLEPPQKYRMSKFPKPSLTSIDAAAYSYGTTAGFSGTCAIGQSWATYTEMPAPTIPDPEPMVER